MRGHGRWSAIVLGVLLVAAAACGDSGSTDTTTPATAAPTTVAATSPPTAATVTTLPPTTTSSTTTTLPPSTVVTLPGVPGLSVSTTGLGSIRVGMTVEEAEEASGLDLVGEPDPTISEDCYLVTVEGDEDYEGVIVMVYQDEVARVEIVSPSQITTRSGAGIGMPEADVRDLFRDNIEDADDYVIDGHAIAYVPSDAVDADYRVVFVIDNTIVSSYRAGILPAVGFAEGCV